MIHILPQFKKPQKLEFPTLSGICVHPFDQIYKLDHW